MPVTQWSSAIGDQDREYVSMTGGSNGNERLMRVRPNDAEYGKLAKAEAAFWQNVVLYSLEWIEKVLADGPIERYINRRCTGDSNVSWEKTISPYGDFRRGLILGMGVPVVEARILQANPRLHVTLVDISEGALERHCKFLTAKYPGRVASRVGDLNFIELEKSAYDLIVSSGVIHHVMNIEYLAFQINQALTDDGFLFMQDYVAEPRSRFSDEKRRIYEAVIARQMEREGGSPELVWESEETLSPSCGVRSDDTLAVFREFLHEEELRTAGALLGPMMRSKCALPPRKRWNLHRIAFLSRALLQRLVGARKERLLDQRSIDDLTFVSDVLEDAGIIKPTIAFGIYRKRLPVRTLEC